MQTYNLTEDLDNYKAKQLHTNTEVEQFGSHHMLCDI